MKVLLDENIPHNLRNCLPGHEVATVTYCGWGGLKNGELLKVAQDAGFVVFITGDRELEYQQNVAAGRIAVIALSDNHRPIIKEHTAKILAAIDSAVEGTSVRVNCGTFSRSKDQGQ